MVVAPPPPFGWGSLPPPPLGGVAFSLSCSCWECFFSSSSSFWLGCLSSSSLAVVRSSMRPLGWCCFQGTSHTKRRGRKTTRPKGGGGGGGGTTTRLNRTELPMTQTDLNFLNFKDVSYFISYHFISFHSNRRERPLHPKQREESTETQ